MRLKAVLVADDDPDFRELVRLVVESWGRPVVEAFDFAGAVELVRRERSAIGLVLLDYFMPGDRETAVAHLRENVPPDFLVLCTACGDISRRAAELGLTRVLPKPLDLELLESAVRRMSQAPL